MKPTKNHHIVCFWSLLITGIFVHLPGFAQSQMKNLQNQSIDLWSMRDQAVRRKMEQLNPTINITFQSRVVSDSSFNSIKDCHIINKTQNSGTVTNAYGEFKITANVNDSISFSALGYEKLTIVLTESMYNYGYIIILTPKAYELEEITITPYYLNLPSISKYEIYTSPLPNQGGINIHTGVSPITALYSIFSKEAKQKRYFKSVIDETAEYIRIGEKFNGQMVMQITGLKDDELIKFMSFCNFSKDFLLNYSPETIIRAIKQKYVDFVGQ